MAEAYPWGAQAPGARQKKIQRELEKVVTARDRYLNEHKAKMAEFDEAEKTLRADLRACEAIIERETRENQSQQLSSVLQKLAAAGKLDLEDLLKDPNLGDKLAGLVAKPEGKKAKAGKAEAKPEATGQSEVEA